MKLLLSLFIFASLAFPVCAEGMVADTTSAATIVHRCESAYAGLKTYLDSGKLVQTMYLKDIPSKTAKIFKTAYSNTGAFNFEYYDLGKSNSLYTINRTDNVIKSWWAVTNKIETRESINMPLGAAVGVSGSISELIPALLLTADFKKNNIFHTLINPELEGTELVDGMLCYKIKATGKGVKKTMIWIAQKDYLIRKIETENVIDPAKTQATVNRLDSIVRSKHLNDTAYLRKDSIRQAKNAKTQAQVKAILALTGNQNAMGVFTVKDSYVFFPYTLKKPKEELFKFRPNREIAL